MCCSQKQRPALTKTNMDIKEEHDEAVILRPALKQKNRDETTNTEECVNDIKEELDEAVKNNTEECVNDIKEEHDEAVILRPALKKKRDEPEECVNGNDEEQDENAEVTDLEKSADEEMFLDGLDR